MQIKEMYFDNIVIGSGAAGLACAVRIQKNGDGKTAIVTENINFGTSRNTGSDKQTYYKLSLSGKDPDSMQQMAEDLFAGGCVDGDLALCEAALSVRSFYHLVEAGVPFPCNEFGEYMGYKTDHDRGKRATSAGPYTSKMMTECLEKEVRDLKIPVLDQMQMIKILVKDGSVHGILCLDKKKAEETYCIVWCENAVLATGGPAGMYHDSVYPESQLGASGTAFQAGVNGKNLTEWQFGMASIKPRWNVSGTYMQVLPAFLSVDESGADEREFLSEYFQTQEDMLSQIFMKGYQWPFDVNKIFGGSSIIDLLVYQETILKKRRVYLDFTRNPGNRDIPFERLSREAYEYLKNANAIGGKTPIERIRIMNEPAIDFYKDHGIDLTKERLEIAICAQHNNGGISTDANWETSIKGLFAIGEVNGSHGITRPGGTALNAGQVGAIRASECIHIRKLWQQEQNESRMTAAESEKIRKNLYEEAVLFLEKFPYEDEQEEDQKMTPAMAWQEASRRMSAAGGMIRDKKLIQEALDETKTVLENFGKRIRKPKGKTLSLYYHLYDMLLAQRVYLSAMENYIDTQVQSRGSALYTNSDGEKPNDKMPELYRCKLDGKEHGHLIQEIQYKENECRIKWREVRPIPDRYDFFENQWKNFRKIRKISK